MSTAAMFWLGKRINQKTRKNIKVLYRQRIETTQRIKKIFAIRWVVSIRWENF
jgi:hypothetical protein